MTRVGVRERERAGPALHEALAAVEEVQEGMSHVAGTLRLTVPRIAVPLVIEPVVPGLLARHPELSVDVSVDGRNVDIVADGYDAGVRLSEFIEKDLVGPCGCPHRSASSWWALPRTSRARDGRGGPGICWGLTASASA
ncbi:LysR substrate-binding domain-containing protein [Pyxidicoccus sp. MSG2]|uniref:LysR substrate-binding domain-containing protein n=1 Tax=Pyxidicoccus sp. MSG2 TaxID=2996790 RepID=UPI002270D25D|nr:LysR substrate-binding domain-containing protein [Pyxidicoccus sp. MSG2]MCY1017158.1 LysR substrate-binding domain-containing protein [Pyxidicoccus sp. MSG2]